VAKPGEQERVVRLEELDTDFSEAIAKAGGEKIYVCFQCGTCAASCPVSRVNGSYNPRSIVRSAVLGLMKRTLHSDDIWLCAACYSCTQRCPRGVRPTEVIRTIRNMAVKKGFINPFFKTQAAAIVNYGRIWKEEEFINEVRGDMGLPPVSVNLDEVAKILEQTKVKDLLTDKKEDVRR